MIPGVVQRDNSQFFPDDDFATQQRVPERRDQSRILRRCRRADLGLVPFVLLDELGRLADQALERDDVERSALGMSMPSSTSPPRAFVVGDWERYRHVILRRP